MQAPEGYRHQIPVEIRFADIDRLDHVNNAKYLTYIEQARIRYVQDQTVASGLDRLGMIIAKVTIEYKQPIMFSDGMVTVWSRCSRLGNKSFDMQHLLLRPDGETAAFGEVVVVSFDYDAGHPVTIPQPWRDYLTGYEPHLT